MRAALGLSAPERRIGQTAHDFVAALGAREAILSRAKKRGGEPTVASRFLQRLAAAAGAARRRSPAPSERGEALSRLRARARSAGRVPARAKRRRRGRRSSCARARSASPGSRPCGATLTRSTPNTFSAEAARRGRARHRARGKPAWPGTRRSRNSSRPSRPAPSRRTRASACLRLRAHALRRFCADPAFAALALAQYRKGARLLSRFRARSARRHRRRSGSSSTARSHSARERRAVQAQRAGRPDRPFALAAARGSSTTRAERRRAQGSRGRICAATDAGGRHFAARRLSGLAGARTRARRSISKLGGAGGGAEKRAGGREGRNLASSPTSISPTSRSCSTQFADKETPYLSRPFPKFAAASPITTISRGSRNGRSRAATRKRGTRR